MVPASPRSRAKLLWLERLDRWGRWLPGPPVSRLLLLLVGPDIYDGYFDPDFYLENYDDIRSGGVNPWKHFVRFGRYEDRQTSVRFDPVSYRQTHEEMPKLTVDSLLYFLLHGEETEWPPPPSEVEIEEPEIIEETEIAQLTEEVPWEFSADDSLRKILEGDNDQDQATGSTNSRITIFDDTYPRIDRDSASLRMHHMTRLLLELGFSVTFVAFDDPDPEWVDDTLMAHDFTSINGLERAVSHLADSGIVPQVALVSRPNVALHVLPLLWLLAPECRIVYDTVDVHWRRMRQQREFDWTIPLDAIDNVRQLERFACTKADAVIALTEEDARVIRQDAPNADVRIVANIATAGSRGLARVDRAGVVFVGSFNHQPNVDAVRYIIEVIAPLLGQQVPTLTVEIVGRDFEQLVVSELPGNVKIRGGVEDLDGLLQTSMAMIVPLRFGAGMKGKLLSAMVNGLPVVTTTVGAEGMALQHGETCLLAETAQDFVDALVQLHEDAALWGRLSSQGLSHILDVCGDDVARQTLNSLFGPVSSGS